MLCAIGICADHDEQHAALVCGTGTEMDAVGPQVHEMLALDRRRFQAVNSAPNSALTRAIVDADSGAAAPSNPRSVGSKSRCASPLIHS